MASSRCCGSTSRQCAGRLAVGLLPILALKLFFEPAVFSLLFHLAGAIAELARPLTVSCGGASILAFGLAFVFARL